MSDLIRRQDAIEVIDAVLPVDPMKSEYAQGVALGAALAKAYVEQLPSAQPKTGHWIMTRDYFTGAYESIDYVKCSCCGEDSLEMGDYCPNCGAKMVDPQESEE